MILLTKIHNQMGEWRLPMGVAGQGKEGRVSVQCAQSFSWGETSGVRRW